MNGAHDSRRRTDSRKRYEGRSRYEDDYGYDFEDERGYRSESRRARAPRGDNRSGRDYEDYENYEDYRDYEDGEDFHYYKHLRLTKADLAKWEKMLHNADGTHGPHYSNEQATMIAEKIGIRFDAYTEREFYICLNMMYADYAVIVSKHMPPEKVLQFLAEMAKAFFDDPDGPEPSEKLALYFHCVVCCGE